MSNHNPASGNPEKKGCNTRIAGQRNCGNFMYILLKVCWFTSTTFQQLAHKLSTPTHYLISNYWCLVEIILIYPCIISTTHPQIVYFHKISDFKLLYQATMGDLHHYVREGERETSGWLPWSYDGHENRAPYLQWQNRAPCFQWHPWDNVTVTLQLAYCVTVSRHFLFLIRYKIIIEQPKVEFSLTWN